jgi:hypothetical protein
MNRYQHDQHVKLYRASIMLQEWINEMGLIFDQWTHRAPTKHQFIDGLGVVAHDANGATYRNAVPLR